MPAERTTDQLALGAHRTTPALRALRTPPGVTLRLGHDRDDAALARLDADIWSTAHAVMPRPEQPLAPFFDGRRSRPEQHLIAELDGELAGYLRLLPPTPLPANAHVQAILGLAVAGRARGRGLGRALLRAAVARARELGARRVTLRVLGHNTPARRLYASEGFVVEGVLPGEMYLDGRYVDDVLMGRTLTTAE
ncbi:GNAT family N-acetyltransferase [Streptomyces sp. NPDC007088]|uniref:GNAT family N-acetyltransferase n=1 Tax=Streptomyces sp. NPDC007088 TaxID=3364773 RepID=UPI00369B2555